MELKKLLSFQHHFWMRVVSQTVCEKARDAQSLRALLSQNNNVVPRQAVNQEESYPIDLAVRVLIYFIIDFSAVFCFSLSFILSFALYIHTQIKSCFWRNAAHLKPQGGSRLLPAALLNVYFAYFVQKKKKKTLQSVNTPKTQSHLTFTVRGSQIIGSCKFMLVFNCT